jgi:hypothetical protein
VPGTFFLEGFPIMVPGTFFWMLPVKVPGAIGVYLTGNLTTNRANHHEHKENHEY